MTIDEEYSQMTAPAEPKFTKRIILFVGIGLVALVAYLYYFIGTVNITEIIEKTNLWIYSLAFFAFLADAFFYALAWHSLLKSLHVKVSIRKVMLYAWAGMFFDAVLPDPGWSGDISKAYMLAKDSGEDPGRMGASVVSQKIIVSTATIVSLIIGFTLLGLNYSAHAISYTQTDVIAFVAIVLALATVSLFVLLQLSLNEKATKRVLDWLIDVASFLRRGRWNPEKFRYGASQTLKKFHEGIRALAAKPRTLVRPVLFSLLSWGFDLSITYIAFLSLGYRIMPDQLLIVYALTGSLQAFGVSFLGFTEIVVTESYIILNVPKDISFLATLLTRIVTLWFKLAISYVVFQWAGVGLLTRKNEDIKSVPAENSQEKENMLRNVPNYINKSQQTQKN